MVEFVASSLVAAVVGAVEGWWAIPWEARAFGIGIAGYAAAVGTAAALRTWARWSAA